VQIPIVPDMLVDLLDAPVPFIVGLTSSPSKQSCTKDNKEFVIIDLDNDKVTTKEALCPLPQLKELYASAPLPYFAHSHQMLQQRPLLTFDECS
jgi:hypothetical protein